MTSAIARVFARLSFVTFVLFPVSFISLPAQAEEVVDVWVASDCGPCAPWKNKVKELTGAYGVGDHVINDGTKTYRIHWMSTYRTSAAEGGSPTGSYPSIQFSGGGTWAAGPVKPIDPEEVKRRAEAAKLKAEADAKVAAAAMRVESERIRKLGRSEEGWISTKTATGTTTATDGFTFPKGTVAYRRDNNKYLAKDADGKITGSDGKVYVDPRAEADAVAKAAKIVASQHGDQVAGIQGGRPTAPLKVGMDLLTAFQQFDSDDANAVSERKAKLEALSEEVLNALYDAEPSPEQEAIKAQIVAESWVCEASGRCHFTLIANDGGQYQVELDKKEGRVRIEETKAVVGKFQLKGLLDGKK